MHNLFTLIGLAALALAAMAWFNPNFIAIVIDAAQHIEDAVTKTGNYNGAALSLGSNFAPGGIGQAMSGVVNVTAIDIASGDETYTFMLQESADGGSNYTDCGIATVLSATAVSTIGSYTVYGRVSQALVRVKLTVGGTTPSITYSTDFGVVGA